MDAALPNFRGLSSGWCTPCEGGDHRDTNSRVPLLLLLSEASYPWNFVREHLAQLCHGLDLSFSSCVSLQRVLVQATGSAPKGAQMQQISVPRVQQVPQQVMNPLGRDTTQGPLHQQVLTSHTAFGTVPDLEKS